MESLQRRLFNNNEHYGLHETEAMAWFISKSYKGDIEDNDLFWALLIEIYQHAECLYIYKEYIEELMCERFCADSITVPDKSVLDACAYEDKENQTNTVEVIKKLWSQPSVEVYRGQHEDDRLNISWTTDKDRAEWFAKRFWFPEEMVGDDYRGKPVLVSGKVLGSNIHFYTDAREEKECLIPKPEELVYEYEKEILPITDGRATMHNA